MGRYSRGSGIGDLIPASGEGRALVEVKGRIGGKGAGMRRRSYGSRARRFENPVNYLWWQPNTETEQAPDDPFPGEHQWINLPVGSNGAPEVLNVSALSFDTPEQTRYGSVTAGATWDESPATVGQRVPLNARLLYTSGKVVVNLSVNETTCVRVAIFELPSDLATGTAAEPSSVLSGVGGQAFNWFWTNDTSVQAWNGRRRGKSPYVPIWWRDAWMTPRNVSENQFGGSVTKVFNVKIRHPTGNVRNSDSSMMALMIGNRARGGNTYPSGMDVMTLLKTSFVV